MSVDEEGGAIDEPADAPAWQTCGTHRYCIQGDVLHWQGHGPMLRSDILTMFGLRQALQRQHGQAFAVVDARDLDTPPADARRAAAEYRPEPPFRGALVIVSTTGGAGLLIRTVVSLVMSAARLLGRTESDLGSLFFVGDFAEAESVIARERRHLENPSST